MHKKINDISNFKFKDGNKIIINISEKKRIYNHIIVDVYEIDHNTYEVNIYDHTLNMEYCNSASKCVIYHTVNRNKDIYIVRMCEEPMSNPIITEETGLLFGNNPFIKIFFDFVDVETHPDWLYKTLVIYDESNPNSPIYNKNFDTVKEHTKHIEHNFYKKVKRAKKIQKLNDKFNQHI